jgi:hypothetical protein
MTSAWLRYKNRGDDDSTVQRYNFLRLRIIEDVDRETRLTLRHFRAGLKRGVHVTFEIRIGAEQLLYVDKLAFIKEWWKADYRWISLSSSGEPPLVGTYIAVETEGGPCPLEDMNGNKLYPAFATMATAVAPL